MLTKANFDLTGKVAIVTGGTQGIGFAVAQGLAAAGARVAITSRQEAKAQKAAGYINQNGGVAIGVVANPVSRESVFEAVDLVLEHFGQIDMLVNNVTTRDTNLIIGMPEEEWADILAVNLTAPFFFCQAVGKHMIVRRQGKVINMTSIMEFLAREGMGAYCSAKGGLRQLTKVLALEWAKYNINVNAVAPGLVVTDELRPKLEANPEDYRNLVAQHPLGRAASPADIVGTVVFLASPASDFITGHTVFVDGGRMCW